MIQKTIKSESHVNRVFHEHVDIAIKYNNKVSLKSLGLTLYITDYIIFDPESSFGQIYAIMHIV